MVLLLPYRGGRRRPSCPDATNLAPGCPKAWLLIRQGLDARPTLALNISMLPDVQHNYASREPVTGIPLGYFVLLELIVAGPNRAPVSSERIVGVLPVVIEVDGPGCPEISLVLNLDLPGYRSDLVLVVEN